jgi:hypothetical protein
MPGVKTAVRHSGVGFTYYRRDEQVVGISGPDGR